MAAADVAGQALGSEPHRAKRTEAMPKNSLFGSLLERQDENTLKEFNPATVRFVKTPPVKGPGQRFTLPEDVKNQLPAAARLEQSRRELDVQRNLVCQTRDELRQKEEKILFDRSSIDAPPSSNRNQPTSKPNWMTEEALAASKEINSVGLNKNQSYNRDKYGQKAPVHNYSLIGDVLRPGMDFPRRERTEVQMRNQGYGMGDLRGVLAQTPPPQKTERQRGGTSARETRKASIDIPPNIKHQFGTKVCDKLFADKNVVEKTVKDQKEEKASTLRTSHPFQVPKFSREVNPEYEMLGNALRMNVVPGYTTDHKISTTKSTYNDQVHLFRNHDPDKWRYQKDELSRWREVRFLQQLLAKGWDNLLDNAPKFKRNWETAPQQRTKTAPTQSTQKSTQPRQKPRTAPKKKPEIQDAGFEEVVFVTPPRTPSPEKVQIVKNERDSEFWDFYDKGGGK